MSAKMTWTRDELEAIRDREIKENCTECREGRPMNGRLKWCHKYSVCGAYDIRCIFSFLDVEEPA